jgi:hypothetical protein
VVDSHAVYGAAATAIDVEEGPCQPVLVSSEMADSYDAAANCNSAASPSQAVAAASSGADPGPEYILPELISGGNAPKSMDFPRSGYVLPNALRLSSPNALSVNKLQPPVAVNLVWIGLRFFVDSCGQNVSRARRNTRPSKPANGPARVSLCAGGDRVRRFGMDDHQAV